MTREEHLHVIAMEECDEVSQRLSKALRFGLHEVQPGQSLNNRDRIIGEFNDLCAALEMVGAFEIRPQLMAEKRARVEAFLAYSEQCGTLKGTGR